MWSPAVSEAVKKAAALRIGPFGILQVHTFIIHTQLRLGPLRILIGATVSLGEKEPLSRPVLRKI
jgi:hypothetical protein